MDNKNSLKNYCKNISYLRKKYELSIEEMAFIMGVSTRAIKRIEAGELPKRSNAKEVIRLALIFQYKSEELFQKDLQEKENENMTCNQTSNRAKETSSQ